MKIEILLIKNIKIIFVIKFEKRVINTSIFSIIINKFFHKKKLCLIILFKIDKAQK